jgi:hypothetical protein
MTETTKPAEYESPVIVEYGEFSDLTQHHPVGDPLHHPSHGDDPHLTSSIS